MELKTAIEILEYHQEWRLGKREDMIHEPKKLTEALDIVLNKVKKLKEYEEKLRWILIEEKVPEIKKDTYQVLIERQDGMLDLIFIHKTMLDYEVKEILIDWYKAVRWRYIFL